MQLNLPIKITTFHLDGDRALIRTQAVKLALEGLFAYLAPK
jgi:hypothetical protein